jgi:hypothetical protein
MAFSIPLNVVIDGTPLDPNAPVMININDDPRATIRADMPKNSSESHSRRMQVDWSIDPDFTDYTTSIDIDGYKSKNQDNYGRVVIPDDPQHTNEQMVLQPDTVYYFRVYAQRSNGTVGSPYKYGSFITPSAPSQPNILSPGNETEIPISIGQINFKWDYSHPQGGEWVGNYFRWRTAETLDAAAGDWKLYLEHNFYRHPDIFDGPGVNVSWYQTNCFPPDEQWDVVGPGECEEDVGNHEVTPQQPLGELNLTTSPAIPSPSYLTIGIFPPNKRIEWQVATIGQPWDENYRWPEMHISEWSESFYFTIVGPTTEPFLVSPIADEAVVTTIENVMEWTFRDPIENNTQTYAELRSREVGASEWTQPDMSGPIYGIPWNPEYLFQEWVVPPNTFEPDTHYEWQVRTTNEQGEVSNWSESATFWAILNPGHGNPGPIVGEPLGALGCGTHRAFIYERGGQRRLGEVTNLTRVQYDRRRDDISEAYITVHDWTPDCGELLASVRSWVHELVIFREHPSGLLLERVWEGPVTRCTYRTHEVEIAAHDVMAYVYRRILRRGFNDAYRLVNGQQLGLKTVVYRARWIIVNALVYDDPNLLPYLTTLQFDDDARSSRVVPEYASSAWEQVDDLAATAGLDYTTVGRRIILNDTHRPVGRLPEMRDGDFGDDPVVSEYGMQGANYYAVTNNAGVWGAADRFTNGSPEFYGYLEMIASAYGEAEGAAKEETLTGAALAALRETLKEQAERNIGGRYPVPVIVRVPDNTTLNPNVEVGINQLVPGVWIPVRSVNTLRPVTQMQKLDRLTVHEEKGEETITVTLSPAPRSGDDTEPTPDEV